MQTREFDFVVIGAGPAGYRGAIEAAQTGAKTALIDRRPRVGGVSLHAGTVPSKTLREAIMYLCGTRQRYFYGADYKPQQEIKLKDLQLRVDAVLRKEMKIMDGRLQSSGIELINGQASFEDEHTLIISTLEDGPVEKIVAKKFLIAVGTVPRHPDEISFDQEVIFDSNFIFSSKNKLKELPKSLIVVGAGVIGTEYACMFAQLGCKVWLVDRRKELFRFLDHDIYDQLLISLSQTGVQLRLEDDFGKISRTPDNRARVEMPGSSALEADAVLFAMGRTPCTFTLNLENTKVVTQKYGTIEVDDHYQTAEEHIYAAGDVIGFPALASTGAEQARRAVHHCLQSKKRPKNNPFPFAIYSIPEISMIGQTEQELIKNETPYAQGLAFYRDLPKGAIVGDVNGALKILFHRETKKILGIHMIGELAAELLHIGSVAMNMGATIDVFTENVFNFPTLAEAFRVAAWNGIEQLEREECSPEDMEEMLRPI